MGILTGIRVLDLATYIAGPAAATVMSDFGAEVFKVERPPYGDPYRYLHMVPGMPASETQYCWLLDSRNKKSLGLNLTHASSRGVLEKLVAWCDVLITNFQPSQLERFALRYEDLHPRNPRLIYASVTGYGDVGDEADKPGFDATAYWARSGLMGSMHNAGADPVQSPAGFGDHPTSMTLFGGIMMALYQRERTGQGTCVSTSLLANGAWSNSCAIQAAFVGAEWPVRRTRTNPNNPLVNHYLSRDGQRIFLCLLDPERDWIRLCNALGCPVQIANPLFSSPALRRENAAQLVTLIDAEIARRDLAEWSMIFANNDVVWGLVPTVAQVSQDPQMKAAGAFQAFEDSDLQTVMSPIHIGGMQKERPRLAPQVGQDSAGILQLLGFTEEEFEQLRACGAVYAGNR